MPSGVPVATVAINNAKNAGILAAQMIGIKQPEVRHRVRQYKAQLATEVSEKANLVETMGYKQYLER
jgi:5-(carboxyamino)imidazole ribonucleotide mutase